MYTYDRYSNVRRHQLLLLKVAIFCMAGFSPALLVAEETGNTIQDYSEHLKHRMPEASAAETISSVFDYTIPDVTVVRQDGKKASFPKELDDGRPVILNFVFASCSAICPMLSHLMAQVQTKLGEEIQKVHLISISIDPENDTPAKLSEYAEKLKAGPYWDHYTGTLEASIAIQKAFNAYRGDKMNHSPVTFLRAAPGKSWVRMDGFTNSEAVIREYRKLLDATKS